MTKLAQIKDSTRIMLVYTVPLFCHDLSSHITLETSIGENHLDFEFKTLRVKVVPSGSSSILSSEWHKQEQT